MTGLLRVEEAQARIFALARPLLRETLPLPGTIGRFLAEPLIARRSQPAAALAAMDGYAIRFADLPGPWRFSGSIAAGQWPDRSIAAKEAMRIFTGAPLPGGADTVLVQEDAVADADVITLTGEGPALAGQHVRAAGSDFNESAALLAIGSQVTPAGVALAAMAGYAALSVGTMPHVAIITTGDELVAPGAPVGRAQIPESNGVMLAALLARVPTTLGTMTHVGDDRAAIIDAIHDASGAHDVIVTIGGASVGDHDHVHAAITSLGAPPDFWKVAMRPGKPLMAARLGRAMILGLPGNPASAFVTAHLFLLPLIRYLAGASAPLPAIAHAPLGSDLGPGGQRRDYLRAVFDGHGLLPCGNQDSGGLASLAAANALLIREAGATAQTAGTLAPYIVI